MRDVDRERIRLVEYCNSELPYKLCRYDFVKRHLEIYTRRSLYFVPTLESRTPVYYKKIVALVQQFKRKQYLFHQAVWPCRNSQWQIESKESKNS